MTDLEFKEFMLKKALDRRKKIFEVRAKEAAFRKATEEDYKILINLLKNFRGYEFIVIRRNKNFPITIYSDTPFQIVKDLIDEIETHYTVAGEMLYKLYTSVK